MTIRLSVYSRSGCHLCEDMLIHLQQLAPELDFSFDIVEITGNPDLEQKYGLRVPVLMADDHEICHYMLDLAGLKAHLQQLKQ